MKGRWAKSPRISSNPFAMKLSGKRGMSPVWLGGVKPNPARATWRRLKPT